MYLIGAWIKEVAMSEPNQNSDSGTDRQVSSAPRAVIHKKILEVAAQNPTASMAEIAGDVSGASTDLVERALDEYGDPADEEADDGAETEADSDTTSTVDDGPSSPSPGADTGTATDADTAADTGGVTESPTGTGQGVTDGGNRNNGERVGADGTANASAEATFEDDETPVDLDELDDTDRALLATVARNPDATQDVVADHLGVSRATVSRRVNGIEGFDWTGREAFVDSLMNGADDEFDAVFDDGPGAGDDTDDSASDTVDDTEAGVTVAQSQDEGGETAEALDDLTERLATVESRVEAVEDDSTGGVFDDPELVHKVVGACMESDRLTEDEEVSVLAALMD